MPKVTNNTGAAIKVLRHMVHADGSVTSPTGDKISELPHSVVHTKQVLRLVREGFLTIEGLFQEKEVVEKEAPVEEEKTEKTDKKKRRR
jgi:hypothetical protein